MAEVGYLDIEMTVTGSEVKNGGNGETIRIIYVYGSAENRVTFIHHGCKTKRTVPHRLPSRVSCVDLLDLFYRWKTAADSGGYIPDDPKEWLT